MGLVRQKRKPKIYPPELPQILKPMTASKIKEQCEKAWQSRHVIHACHYNVWKWDDRQGRIYCSKGQAAFRQLRKYRWLKFPGLVKLSTRIKNVRRLLTNKK